MKEINNKSICTKLKELINEKTEKLSEIYCAYRASLKSYEERPDLFLEKDITERTGVLAKEIATSRNEINMLLGILFNQEYMQIDPISDLKDFSKTKKIKVTFIKESTFDDVWRCTREYGIYNANTGELKLLQE